MPIKKAKCAKIPYDSKAEAIKDISYIKTQQKFRSHKFSFSNKTGKKLTPYECRRCGFWHITTSVNYRKAMKKEKK